MKSLFIDRASSWFRRLTSRIAFFEVPGHHSLWALSKLPFPVTRVRSFVCRWGGLETTRLPWEKELGKTPQGVKRPRRLAGSPQESELFPSHPSPLYGNEPPLSQSCLACWLIAKQLGQFILIDKVLLVKVSVHQSVRVSDSFRNQLSLRTPCHE